MKENIDGREIIDIKNIIFRTFGKSEWLDLAYSLNCQDVVNEHPRLLRSLSFGDDDYEGNILEVLGVMVKRNGGNLAKIKQYLAERTSHVSVSEFISTVGAETPRKIITFSPQVFDIPDKPIVENLVAVMMPFSAEFKGTFEAINLACKQVGFECKKANDIWVNSTIIQDIFELIFLSKIVVGDFTGKNPNVFYEIGIAHTLGKAVVPITQFIDDVPADLRHHRVLKYLPNEQGYKDLQKDLSKRLDSLKPKTDW